MHQSYALLTTKTLCSLQHYFFFEYSDLLFYALRHEYAMSSDCKGHCAPCNGSGLHLTIFNAALQRLLWRPKARKENGAQLDYWKPGRHACVTYTE